MRRSLFLLVFLVFSHAVKSEELIFNSGNEQVQLIELYTSEGCSSCPPADRWLSRLKKSDELWETFIPVAFHVAYWDYIGWKDRFAKQEYAQRQRRYAAEFSETTVYTPGVRLAGAEWRDWLRAGVTIPSSAPQDAPGNLSLSITNDGGFKANFTDRGESKFKSAQLTVAILGQSLTTQVARGENKGRTLNHDFVVLANTTVSGQHGDTGFDWEGRLPKPAIDAKDYAVAAWVSVGGSQVPVQALGGPIPSDLSISKF